jgi:hypothetical protein
MAERLRGDNVLLQMFRTTQAVRELMAASRRGSGRASQLRCVAASGHADLSD